MALYVSKMLLPSIFLITFLVMMHLIPSLGWAAILWCFSNNAVATQLWPRISDTQPIVNLRYAQCQGKTLSSSVNQYLGMRFAAPPIRDLRFRAPAIGKLVRLYLSLFS